MRICEVLSPENIIPELKGTTKVEVINELIDLFKNDDRVLDLKEVKASVLERENYVNGHRTWFWYSSLQNKQSYRNNCGIRKNKTAH